MKNKLIFYICIVLLIIPAFVNGGDVFPRLPLVVYSEAFSYNRPFQFVPSGWMGDVHATQVNDAWKRDPHSGDTCMRFQYDTTVPWIHGWTGVCWQYPANNWGNINGGVNLTGAKKLTFWAKGESGEEFISFKVGGNYGVFSDTTEIIIGPVKLSKIWKKYSIELINEDLSHISCGFGWVIDKTHQVTPEVIFYLDEMRFE